MPAQRLTTLFKAVAAQALGFALTVTLAALWPGLFHGIWHWVLVQSAAAALWAYVLRQPAWWPAIHVLFWPAAITLLMLHLPAWLYLAALLLLALVFWGTVNGDVPLFLSSAAVADTLAGVVERENAKRFADLGAGIGSVVAPLAQRRPLMAIDAFEHAPLPWLIIRRRCRKLSNVSASHTSFWNGDLSSYDVIFAFLSPAVMLKLGEKISREMRPGSLFISSSFPIPDWRPESIMSLEDRRKTTLFCYRIKKNNR